MSAAMRSLIRSPRSSLTAIITLGVGFAISASMIAVVNAYLLRSLPYPAAGRLYQVIVAPPGQREPAGVSAFEWSAVTDVVDLTLAHSNGSLYITDPDGSTSVADAAYVTPGYAEGMGLRPVLGAPFGPADYVTSGVRPALVADGFWRRRFGSDPNVVGREFRAYSNRPEDAATYRVAGVLPSSFWPGFRAGRFPEVFVPAPPGLGAYLIRLREGVPAAAAERRITDAMRAQIATIPPDWRLGLRSLHDQYVAEARPMLAAVSVTSALVLLVVSFNLTVLLLLGAMRRQREIAVRAALGASWRHVFRMLATEAAILGAAAMVVGVAVSALALPHLAPIVEQQIGRAAPGGTAAIALDGTVIAILLGAGAVVVLAFSVAPLVAAGRRDLASVLRHDARTGTGRTSRRLRSALIALEIAGALTLLAAGGLMGRTLVHLLRLDLGYDLDHLVRARIVLPAQPYPDAAARAAAYDRLIERLATVPGVRKIALAGGVPFWQPPLLPVDVDGASSAAIAAVTQVAGEYFPTLGLSRVDGGPLGPAHRFGGQRVAVVSESLARRLWPDGRAVGRRLRTVDEGTMAAPMGDWRTVIGVARDVRQTFTDDQPHDVYLPFLNAPGRFIGVYLRVDDPDRSWEAPLRAAGAAVDRAVLIEGGTPVARTAGEQLASRRWLASMLLGFAAFAGLLAVIGVSSAIAYDVEQRRREIAIRAALGATRSGITRLFLRDGGLVIGLGLAAGLAAAPALGGLLGRHLFGVEPFDAPTYAMAALVLIAAATPAIWWPARRAASQDPQVILKEP
jgi:putative ABC transport system permease protein